MGVGGGSADVIFIGARIFLGISWSLQTVLASLPSPSFPWCFCFLGVFFCLEISLVFLSVFCLFYRVFEGSHGEKNLLVF